MALSMVKNAPVALGEHVSHLRVGAGWITGKTKVKKLGKFKIGGGKEKEIDLDLITVALEGSSPKRMAWFGNEDAFRDGSLIASPDNQTGAGDGDDESHTAQLDKIPGNIDKLVFIVAAAKPGVTFKDVEGVDLKVYTENGSTPFGTFMVDISSRHNAIVAGVAERTADGWFFRVVNETDNVATSEDHVKDSLLQLAARY
jgi:stress response protein SCP2